MSRFTGKLTISEIAPGKTWCLEEDIKYFIGSENSKYFIVIPKGYSTDGASIPSFLQIVLSVWGTYGRAACIHDYMYDLIINDQILIENKLNPIVSQTGFDCNPDDVDIKLKFKNFADDVFLESMLVLKTNKFLAYIMWISVKFFGQKYINIQ